MPVSLALLLLLVFLVVQSMPTGEQHMEPRDDRSQAGLRGANLKLFESMFYLGCVVAAVVALRPLPGSFPETLVLAALTAVSAGFPSPAQDYFDGGIDLNKHLIHDTTSTFIVRVSGDSMTGAGISDGDELIVDRAAKPVDGSVVVAVLDGELTVKRLRITSRGVVLAAENPDYPDIRVAELADLSIWGVAKRCLHYL
jgi:DNA polymerase V